MTCRVLAFGEGTLVRGRAYRECEQYRCAGSRVRVREGWGVQMHISYRREDRGIGGCKEAFKGLCCSRQQLHRPKLLPLSCQTALGTKSGQSPSIHHGESHLIPRDISGHFLLTFFLFKWNGQGGARVLCYNSCNSLESCSCQTYEFTGYLINWVIFSFRKQFLTDFDVWYHQETC